MAEVSNHPTNSSRNLRAERAVTQALDDTLTPPKPGQALKILLQHTEKNPTGIRVLAGIYFLAKAGRPISLEELASCIVEGPSKISCFADLSPELAAAELFTVNATREQMYASERLMSLGNMGTFADCSYGMLLPTVRNVITPTFADGTIGGRPDVVGNNHNGHPKITKNGKPVYETTHEPRFKEATGDTVTVASLQERLIKAVQGRGLDSECKAKLLAWINTKPHFKISRKPAAADIKEYTRVISNDFTARISRIPSQLSQYVLTQLSEGKHVWAVIVIEALLSAAPNGERSIWNKPALTAPKPNPPKPEVKKPAPKTSTGCVKHILLPAEDVAKFGGHLAEICRTFILLEVNTGTHFKRYQFDQIKKASLANIFDQARTSKLGFGWASVLGAISLQKTEQIEAMQNRFSSPKEREIARQLVQDLNKFSAEVLNAKRLCAASIPQTNTVTEPITLPSVDPAVVANSSDETNEQNVPAG